MSRRTPSTVRQVPRILRFFSKHAAGVSFAYVLGRSLIAALSCGLVGGCVVTSAEEFPEELQVPPVIVDRPDFPLGSIIRSDQTKENGLRLEINVRDQNIDDVLQVHATLTVVGQRDPDLVCPMRDLETSGQPDRGQYDLVIDRAKIRAGTCSLLDVYVSRKFVGTCTDKPNAFTYPRDDDDFAHATFYIWEMSGDPVSNPSAATDLVNTCPTITLAGTSTAMPMSP
jgi:hypothetical protein